MTYLDQLDPATVAGAIEKLRATQPGYIEEMADGDERLALWLALVDRRMLCAVGVTHRDIADWTWRDGFDAGMTPAQAAIEALANDGTFSVLAGEL